MKDCSTCYFAQWFNKNESDWTPGVLITESKCWNIKHSEIYKNNFTIVEDCPIWKPKLKFVSNINGGLRSTNTVGSGFDPN